MPPACHRRPAIALTLALSALCGATAQAAEDQPLWEAGLGLAAFSFPAYRGSDQRSQFLLPAPYFVYRGEFFKADREGLRAELFDSDRFDLTISGALSPPAASEDIRARAGMPDLDATVEVGPQLNVKLWTAEDGNRQLQLLMPLRTGFTLNRNSKNIGWVFHPKLNLDIGGVSALPGWAIGLQAGPLFGDRRQHQHIYGVDAAFATPERPSYQARAGFAGMQYLVGVSKRYRQHWVGAFVRYDDLRGAAFVDSPLVRDRRYFALGVAWSWILGESSTRVPGND